MSLLATVDLFGLRICSATFQQAVSALLSAAQSTRKGASVVVTPNVDHIVRLSKTPGLHASYGKADFIFADGMPVVWASRLLNQRLPERVTGADLFVELCRCAVERGWRIAVVGGDPGSEQLLRAHFAQTYPGLDVQILCPSMQFDPLGNEAEDIADRVRKGRANITFVCLGMPKQEIWALHYASTFPGGLVVCAGAAMLFALGLQQRAPAWIQRAGFEWLWRLASDPRRLWRRYLVDDMGFLALCWSEWKNR